jgi:hypothetical protein
MNLLDAINRFIASSNPNLEVLDTYQLSIVQELIKLEHIVPAIKQLRELTKTTKCPMIHKRENSTFVRFLNSEDISLGKENKLGLKEAKDVIDFLNDNRDIW